MSNNLFDRKVEILIVEDNIDFIHFIKNVISDEMYLITSIKSGTEAFNYLNNPETHADIVLLDYKLPGMNGLEILEKLGEGKDRFSFIFLTVDDSIETVVKAMTAGALDFVVKSIELKNELPGKISKVLKIHHTKLQKAQYEKELEEARFKFKTVADFTNDWDYWQNPDGSLQYVSPSFKRFTGYEVEDLNENPGLIDAIIFEDDKTKWEAHRTDVGTIHKPDVMQVRIKRKDGDIRWIEHNCQPVIDPHGSFLGIRVNNHDITERVLSNEKIKLNSSRLHDLLELSQHNITDKQEIFDHALNTAVKITQSACGYLYHYDEKTKEFVLNSWTKCGIEGCNTGITQQNLGLDEIGFWGEAVRQRKTVTANNIDRESSNEGYFKGCSNVKNYLVTPFFENEEINFILGVANKPLPYDKDDVIQLNLLSETVWKIFQQKNDEKKIREMLTELKELNATKDKFVSIIAHDLRSPIGSINSFLEVISDNLHTFSQDTIEKYINTLKSQTQNTFNLLEDILLWAHSQSSKIPFEPEIVRLKDLCNEEIMGLQISAENKKINVSNKIQNTVELYADRNMLKTTVRNLLSNAIKFTHENGNVSISAEQGNSAVTITVSDNGIGIGPQKLTSVFEISQVNSSLGTADEKGTGLGLTLCKDFVEKHDGKIWIESEIDKGTDVKFSIPVNQQEP
ncbi:ATP-binding protein [Draconibacterium sp. IB214405]|uniref:hybrid sensor histidine kinase/response regulator n=1 Tax=Draconibacterium sp. IB214405 TaxID=3097352 RepID=UPI002A131CD3|nr:ATP-binding protein [Draconibacterium sp. IB214405]MDX8337930.1 ATP-binding protein [Draconibacterium sp. IB214405]